MRERGDQPVGAAAGVGTFEHLQPALENRILDQQLGEHRAAQPGKRARQRLPGVGDRDMRLGALGEADTPVDPALGRLDLALPLAGGGLGDRDPRGGGQLDPLQLARPVDQPHRAVEVRLGEIGVLVGDEGEADIGVEPGEGGQPRGEPLGVELARRGDGVAVARLPGLHRLDALLELEEALAQGFEPGGALLGQLEPLAGAAEQDRAQMILERADLLADRGRRDRQLVGGAGEAEVPRGGIVNAQGVEGQMGALHDAPRLGSGVVQHKPGQHERLRLPVRALRV